MVMEVVLSSLFLGTERRRIEEKKKQKNALETSRPESLSLSLSVFLSVYRKATQEQSFITVYSLTFVQCTNCISSIGLRDFFFNTFPLRAVNSVTDWEQDSVLLVTLG